MKKKQLNQETLSALLLEKLSDQMSTGNIQALKLCHTIL